jgi:hypothetical protein
MKNNWQSGGRPQFHSFRLLCRSCKRYPAYLLQLHSGLGRAPQGVIERSASYYLRYSHDQNTDKKVFSETLVRCVYIRFIFGSYSKKGKVIPARGWDSNIFRHSAHRWQQGCQAYAPATLSAQQILPAVNLYFLDPGRLLFHSSSSSVILTGLSGPRSRPTTSQKIW